jgi:proteasome accessory factor B
MYYRGEGVQQKVHTVSRKSERLVNLTIALLATKRWLTKSEIFASIDGYEGEADAMERMFERDKDDLRNLGITIEVGSFDPLFDDEVGYRIRPESYRSDISALSSREIALLSLARQAWQGAVLDSTAQSGLVKLKSLGIDSDFDSLPAMASTLRTSDKNLPRIIDAISERRVISFDYLNAEFEEENRAIEPYGVATQSGYWYAAGKDLDRKELRIFRLDRFASEVNIQGSSNAFEIPESFQMTEVLTHSGSPQFARIRVRRGRAHALRQQAHNIVDGDDWSELELPYFDEATLLNQVLWHGEDAIILEPESAQQSAIRALQELVALHG